MTRTVTPQRQTFAAILLTVFCFIAVGLAQTTAFTYQGRLTDAGNSANGNYDLQFKLFDTPTVGTGTQAGATLVRNPVVVSAGVFTVTLDFGATVFTGAARYVEIGVRPAGSGNAYTVLSPRQPITSSPYAIQTLNATQLGGVDASQYVTTTNGGTSFIRNATTQQADANFNISGNGILGGSLGIGTTAPETKLSINTPGTAYGLTHTNGSVKLTTSVGGNFNGGYFGTRSLHPLFFFTNDSGPLMTVATNGNVGVGTTAPETRLSVKTANNDYGLTHTNADGSIKLTTYVGGNFNGAYFGTRSLHPLFFFTNDSGPQMTVATNGNVGIGTAAPAVKLHVAGDAKVNVLEVAGSDVAEHFEMAEDAKPGLVVAIDAGRAGKLALARGAYNRRVAGVITGANNLPAGMVLPDVARAQQSMPVALSGRVWVYCDARGNPIQPGDLLTTSNTPGHAMKVRNYAQAQGAIIGKAMTGLKTGRGLVLVLVTLQ
jgi:hypothetical protein